MTPQPTHIDGRFAIEAELGRGAMGRVLLVRDEFAGSAPYACKVLERPELRHDFLSEFWMLRRLSHPSFVRAHQLGVELATRQPYAILELCRGATLADAPAGPDELEPFAVALLRAIDHLHRHGFVHGDLAPANVVRQQTGPAGLKIVDLGAGGRRGARRGSTSGVLAYAAPERLAGEPLEPSADLWSLGCLLFEMAHGRHPWPGYPTQTGDRGAPSMAGLERHALDGVFARLLAERPEERYPTAAAALAEIESTTGREHPLIPIADRARRTQHIPYLDVDGQLERLSVAMRDAADAGRPWAVDVDGPLGSGRSRLLSELEARLAARGIPVVRERVLPSDGGTSCLARVVLRLGGTVSADADASATIQALGRALAEHEGPIGLLVDDLDRGPAEARTSFDALARGVSALPTRFSGLLLATVGGTQRDVARRPWSTADVERLIETLFPQRRVGARVAEPIKVASRGNVGLAVAILEDLLASEAIAVDAAAVRLVDAERVRTAAPSSLEAVAEARLEQLDEHARAAAAVLAYAQRPAPAAVAGPAVAALVAAQVACVLPSDAGPRYALASEATARAAQALTTPVEAHRELAKRWRAWAEDGGAEARLEAAWHGLLAGAGDAEATSGALSEAEALVSEGVGAAGARLVAEMTRLGWPGDARAALRGGEVLEAAARVDAALALYRRAVALATEADDREMAARGEAAAGRLEARHSRHQAALTALRAALAVGGEQLAREERAQIAASLARSEVLCGELDEAERHAEEALALGRDDDAVRGRALYCQGLVRWYRGELTEAQSAFEVALEATRAVGDRVEEAAVLTGMGLIAHRRGALDDALARYREALALGDEAGDDARVLTALQNLGVVYHERGDWTEALDTYREALGLAEALDAAGRIVQLAGNLGNLWRYLGELDAAGEILQRGLALARRERNRYMEAILLNLLADVASDNERWEEAQRLWEEAIAVAIEGKYATEEAEARINLGRLHATRLGFDDARRTISEGLRVVERLDNATLQCQGIGLLAGVERASVHGSAAEAQALIARALALDAQVTNPDARWPVHLEAARIARDAADHARAAAELERCRALLQQQLDAVPGKHRDAFRARRGRALAWRETEVNAQSAPVAAASGGGDLRLAGWPRLVEINKRLLSETSVTRLLEYIMDSAILLTEAERGFLLLIDDDSGELDVHVARNLDQENVRKRQLKISHGIAHRVIESGEPVVTLDAMEDARYRDQLSVHDLKLRSILCLPLSAYGKVLGAVYLDNRFRPSAFSTEDVRFMEAFADLAAIALNNARLIEGKERAQEALTQAREEVEALNAKLSTELAARKKELEDTHRVVIHQRRQLVAKNQYDNIIGTSDSIRRIYAMMDRLLDNDVPVLIEGESGTGKELVARAIHFNGARQSKPFVAINCGAIPGTLLESELFGHVRGAFTSAMSDKIGLFEAAHHGTLLLDEIGELPLEMQVKLLRVLQSGEVKKVGATRETRVDVRILAATNRRLQDEVAAGRFREDLFYRLSVVPIQVPSLRERKEDIPLLVAHFLEQNRAQGLGEVTGVSKEALSMLMGYAWPGNVRQLEMVLKNASVFADNAVLEPRDFEALQGLAAHEPTATGTAALRGKCLSDIEREAIIVALRDNRGNKKRTAEQLGIDRRTLYNKLASYNIVVEKELHVS